MIVSKPGGFHVTAGRRRARERDRESQRESWTRTAMMCRRALTGIGSVVGGFTASEPGGTGRGLGIDWAGPAILGGGRPSPKERARFPDQINCFYRTENNKETNQATVVYRTVNSTAVQPR